MNLIFNRVFLFFNLNSYEHDKKIVNRVSGFQYLGVHVIVVELEKKRKELKMTRPTNNILMISCECKHDTILLWLTYVETGENYLKITISRQSIVYYTL